MNPGPLIYESGFMLRFFGQGGLGFWQLLNIRKFFADGARSGNGGIDGFAGLIQTVTCCFEYLRKAAEICFDFAKKLPDFIAAFFDGHRAETQLQRVQHGGKGSGAGNDHALVPLERLQQIR